MSMRTRLRALVPGLAVIVLVVGIGQSPVRATPVEAACWQDWSDAAAVVEREQLASAKGVHVLARQHVGADLVRITLCRNGDAFVYRLVVRDAQGRLSTHTVDARRPFHR